MIIRRDACPFVANHTGVFGYAIDTRTRKNEAGEEDQELNRLYGETS